MTWWTVEWGPDLGKSLEGEKLEEQVNPPSDVENLVLLEMAPSEMAPSELETAVVGFYPPSVGQMMGWTSLGQPLEQQM